VTARAPDLDAEQDLDLGGLWASIVERWWLPVAGLIVGAILGYIVSFGGSGTYSAQAVVYLGQPLSPGGGGQLQSLASNPTAVRQIVGSAAVIRAVAARSGLTPAQLRGHTTANPVAGAIVKAGQTPLITITVRGGSPRRTALAANSFAHEVVANVSGYVAGKMAGLRARIQQDRTEESALRQRLTVLNAALAQKNLSLTDQLIVSGQTTAAEQQLTSAQQDELAARQLLSLAQNVEASRIVTAAVAQKATARSKRNYLVVGAFIGLIVGIVAALLWEPVARSTRRPAA
jgi:uncharacterized protein involved in exopolysaccharide biosynthesis